MIIDPPANPSEPDVNYALEYVYGYRCADSRQNVFFNASGQAVYMTAALGVILDQNSNTQKFFGGGHVDNKAKNVSNDENAHTDDITSITMSSDRRIAASGQVGSAPAAFVWDAVSGQKRARCKLMKGARGVNAIALSYDSKYVALVDLHDSHYVYVYDAATGEQKWRQEGDSNKIFDICFTAKNGDYTFATAGSKHIKFWNAENFKAEKGIFGGKAEMTSFACVAYDDQGKCFTGGCNSLIYVWEGKELKQTIPAHKGGFICALRFAEGKLYSGGKDGNIAVTNTSTLAVERTISMGGVLIRAIDVVGSKALVGMRDGTIYEMDINTQNKKAIMESHSDGEVWGLAIAGDHVITSGDDNKIKTWNTKTRKCEATGKISDAVRKAKRGGASSLTELPDSQCSRAVAYNPRNSHVAIGHNDGTLTIRAGPTQLDKIIATHNHSSEWIEAMEYSPDGSKLAVGSHDNKIYVYDSNSYALLGKCTAHNSFIVSVDWSKDGQYIRSVCGAHELLWHKSDTYQQDKSGASNTRGVEFATGHAKYGWLVEGIFPSGTDGTHINGVDFSKDGTLIATGDDYGLVNIFRNPARFGHTPVSLRGHSEHVVRVAFNSNDSYIFSVGGYDQTLMQWKRA